MKVPAYITLALTVITMVHGGNADNKTIPEMPLGMFKSTGLYAAMMAGSSNYSKLMIEKFQQIQKKPVPARVGQKGEPGQDKNKDWSHGSDSHNHIKGGMGGSNGYERSDLALTIGETYAGCEPYLLPVNLPNDRPDIVLYPSCVKLKRCGGCCDHSTLTCKPTETKAKKIEVIRYQFDGSDLKPLNVTYQEVEDHTACRCQCKITEDQCNPKIHEHDNYTCSCQCKNKNRVCSSDKRWDENICACRCREIQGCGSGNIYNLRTCKCEAKSDGLRAIHVAPKETATSGIATIAPCAGTKCERKYYKAVPRGGGCKCMFDRAAYIMSRG